MLQSGEYITLSWVHCVHAFFNRGVEFRKSFKEIGRLRALIEAPFMALTASAPSTVQSEIISSLHLVDPVIVSGDLNRRNIFISASAIKSSDVGTVEPSYDLPPLGHVIGCLLFMYELSGPNPGVSNNNCTSFDILFHFLILEHREI